MSFVERVNVSTSNALIIRNVRQTDMFCLKKFHSRE